MQMGRHRFWSHHATLVLLSSKHHYARPCHITPSNVYTRRLLTALHGAAMRDTHAYCFVFMYLTSLNTKHSS